MGYIGSKSKLILSCRRKGLRGNSSPNVHHGEADGGNDFSEQSKNQCVKCLERNLTFSELNTLLIRIEGIINSRPLTGVSDDCRYPLSVIPAHHAIGRPINQLPESKEESLEKSSKRTVERYLYLQRLLNHYWKRWQREYLYPLS